MAVNINVPSQVKTYANLAAFPATGALKTIYIAEETNKTYRWTGSVYTEISASAAMTWGAIGGTLSNQTDLQSALDAKVPTSRTLTINGVTQDLSANRTFTISTGITIGSTAIASGVVGRVLFQGTGNVVQESGNLFWDNPNGRLGIGTSSPATRTHIVYDDNTFLNGLYVQNTNVNNQAYTGIGLQDAAGTIRAGFQYIPSTFGATALQNSVLFVSTTQSKLGFVANSSVSGGTAQDIYFSTLGSNTTYQMQIKGNTGNVQIGTNTDAGFRLDVNGTTRVQSTFTVNGNINADSYIKYATSCWVRGFSNTLQISDSGVNPKIALHTASGTSYFNSGGNYVFGATTANASAMIQIDSTTQGFLPPRMTTTQKNAIATPAAGLMVYDTTLNVISYYNGSMWI